MSEPRDELDALRNAWHELRAPEGTLEGSGPGSDEETRACVEWMRGAWAALEAPERTLALPGQRSEEEPGTRRRSLRRVVLQSTLPFAAAACAVLLLEVGLRPVAPPPTVGVELAQATPARAPIRPVVHADGSLEMRHGNVRLILLPDPEPSSPDNDR